MCTHNCPDKVQWQPIDLKLQKNMIKLGLVTAKGWLTVVPKHLDEPNIKQYEVTAYFSDAVFVEKTLEAFTLNWSGVSYDIPNCAARAEGGVVFKRKSVPGYFVLKRPCLSCYVKLAERCNDDVETLKRAMACCFYSHPRAVIGLNSREDGCCA